MSIPDQIHNPDLEGLRELVREVFDKMCAGEEEEDSDMEHYIFEEVIMALYGKNAFEIARKIANQTVFENFGNHFKG